MLVLLVLAGRGTSGALRAWHPRHPVLLQPRSGQRRVGDAEAGAEVVAFLRHERAVAAGGDVGQIVELVDGLPGKSGGSAQLIRTRGCHERGARKHVLGKSKWHQSHLSAPTRAESAALICLNSNAPLTRLSAT